MSWWSDHWLLWLLVACYTLILFHHARLGRASTGKHGGLAGFYVGGRSLGGLVVGVSFFATFASTNTYVGNAGKAYEYGVAWLVTLPFMVLFTLLSWTLVAPRMRQFASHWDALTLPDFLAARFSDRAKAVRLGTATVVVFSSILYLIAIFKGAGNLFEQFLDVPYWAAVVITLGFVVAYTSIGGFISVVRTDVVQGGLMLIGALMIFY
ncbi:MAG: hypothetical protein O3A63_08830, partial [Proteobacteria bacterium]|nr:hypothetical protein [Pseudomonadota bacterium]